MFAVTPQRLTLRIGDSVKLAASLAHVAWSSSAPQVVSVSPSGRVQALASGSAVIRASKGSQKASAIVEVPVRLGVLSEWRLEHADDWSECQPLPSALDELPFGASLQVPAGEYGAGTGIQTRTESWVRDVLIAPSAGAPPVGPLRETRTATQPCIYDDDDTGPER